MMQVEFERIAGYEVTAEDYNNIIEPMYMAIIDVVDSKEDFVKMIDRNRFDYKGNAEKKMKKLEKEMKKLAQEIYGEYADWSTSAKKDRIEELADEITKITGCRHCTNEEIIHSFFYPVSVEFYDKNFETVKMIELVKKTA